jgi:competence protein ComEC
MQLAIVVGLLPLMLFYFQQASLIAIFANAIAIPWVGFLILPLALMATLLFFCRAHLWSHDLFWLAGKLLLPLWKFLQYIAHFSFASWHHAVSNKWILIAGMMGSIFLLAPRGLSARFLGCFGFLPLFFYHPAHPAEGAYRATVIDVGQGLAVLVQTAHHAMLYETIDKNRQTRKFHESIISSYLRKRDISTVNRVIQHAETNQSSWNWDGVYFKVFDHTSVIRVSNASGSLLLTGNIQKYTESRLIKKYGDQLRSTVLLVPYAGSVKAYEKSFIDTVSPQDAIVSAGEYNRYHWPAKSVLSRYLQRGIKVYNTAHDGAITIRFLRKGGVRLCSIFQKK